MTTGDSALLIIAIVNASIAIDEIRRRNCALAFVSISLAFMLAAQAFGFL